VEALRGYGHTREAERVADRVTHWFDNRPPNESSDIGHREWYARALFLAGRHSEAQDVLDALVDEFPDGPHSIRATRAFVAGIRGDTAQALSDAAWFQDLGLQPFETIAFRVAIAAGLGDAEGAMRLLRKANMHWSFFGYDQTDMLYEPLRDYPPWREFLRPKG
jgi:hypothetical protein